uniref:SCP domain-containing protein n=1 Tax=Glossina palpalis gambiensis TaxID=67801 RepID=A0A1B0B3G0_9MUSC
MNKIFFLIYYIIIGIDILQFERFGAIGFNFCSKKRDVNELCGHMKAEETGLAMVHIACEAGVLRRNGEHYFNYPMTEKLKNYILRFHNECRHRIAGGDEIILKSKKKFPIAARMRELIWDDELAYVAHALAERCNIESKNVCQTTPRFQFPGQTKASKMTNTEIKAMGFIHEVLNGFESQSQEINDPVTQMHLHTDNFCYFFVCNYDFSPQNDSYVYLHSKSPGSGCNQWKTSESRMYPNLCAGDGAIFPESYGKRKKIESLSSLLKVKLTDDSSLSKGFSSNTSQVDRCRVYRLNYGLSWRVCGSTGTEALAEHSVFTINSTACPNHVDLKLPFSIAFKAKLTDIFDNIGARTM